MVVYWGNGEMVFIWSESRLTSNRCESMMHSTKLYDAFENRGTYARETYEVETWQSKCRHLGNE